MKYLFFILVVGLPFSLCGQNKRLDFEFSLIFGSCFSNDTIGIKVNGVSVVNNAVIKTNVVGAANLSLTQRDRLKIESLGRVKVLSKISLKEILRVSVAINGKWAEYKFNLKKGKILFANNCIRADDGFMRPGFNIIQQNHPVYFF